MAHPLRLRLLLLLSLLSTVCAIQIPFQRPPSSSKGALITPEIDTFVKSQLSLWNSSGLSVAVVQQDTNTPGTWNVEFGSYGTAQADGSPVTPDTLFAIASNSKLFLSISVGLLIKNESLAAVRGQELRWDTKIKTVLPEWALLDEDMQNGVMIQDMLSHRTGLPRHDYSSFAREGGVSEMISTMRFLRPSAELRETYQYNNLMYETLSHLPPTLLNQTFESFAYQHLFEPLGMNSSTYSVAEAEKRGALAHGFHWDMQDYLFGFNGTRTATVPYFQRYGEERIWAGAGGILTSARDLSSWTAILLNKGRHPTTNETVVPEDVVEHVAHGVSVARGKAPYPELSPAVYGCGQDRSSYRGYEIIEHGGSNPGFKTQVSRFPNDNLGVVVLSNDENGGHILESVKWRIVDHVFGLEPIDWAQRYLPISRKNILEIEPVSRSYGEELAKSIRKNQDVTPRPSPDVPPSVPFSAMEGTFSHGAYGSIQPCFVQSKSAGLSAACTSMLTTPRWFSTHLRFAHFAGNTFNVSLIWTNGEARAAEGYPEGGDVVVGLDDRYEVEWVGGNADGAEEEGWAFKGNFWGKAGDVRPLEGVGKDAAEVWFGRA
ncbi:beta-lactamase/transpeptidase-like protein [Mycena albidolilacea]|uniref:Beta-lactamase/transpeptidase-like protein n=1 Tax=Mycena albidolilacea TaxID=1033008 RepID=A0AAD7A695_9AGAR|nr:beta-lactamase/transpeptidase-like protein [Mycena albidolilacea]